MVKKIAEKFNRLSRVHQRHRQTDRQTTDNRQTTDGRLIAYSDREREFTFAKNWNASGLCQTGNKPETITDFQVAYMANLIFTRHRVAIGTGNFLRFVF